MLTREIILAAIEKSDIDGVLITTLADNKKKVHYTIEGANPYVYYINIHDAMYGPGRISLYDIKILFLKTNFYDLDMEKLIWSMTSESEYRSIP